VRAPDGTVRTGDGVVDSAGFVEVLIPINVPQDHTILSVDYYPGGSASGPAISLPPTDITPNGVLDGSFPATQCDRDATLALVPSTSDSADAESDAKRALTTSASLFAPLVSLDNPGADVHLQGPW